VNNKNNIIMNKMDFTNNLEELEDQEDLEENYRNPIPTINQNLMYGDFEQFGEYKKKINARDDLDEDMKQVLISTRREFLVYNMPELLNELDQLDQLNDTGFNSNNDSVERANSLVNFVTMINQFASYNDILTNRLKNKLNDYISCRIDLIVLDTESFIEYEIILQSINLDTNTSEYIRKIIIPENLETLDEYKQVVEQSKKDWESQQEKIKFEEEKLLIIKEERIKLTQLLMIKITKLSNYDSNIKILNDILTPLFDEFNKLTINSINVEEDILNKIKDFINKSRFTEEEKNNILKIFI
jgi:hypothetical protein